jgi:biopolymer transport protein ExbB
MLLNILLQIPEQMSNALDAPTEISMPLWELTKKGGWIMIPIAILSIIAVYIFVERYFAIRKAAQTDENFMNRIKDYIYDGKIEAALDLCRSTDSPIARMIEKGIQRIGRPLSDINTAIENVGRLEVFKLERGLPALATAAGGAPMLGFLGTVTGMVKAFYDMSMAGNNIDIGILSSGIYEAMVTTVAGLLVGIIAYFAYNILVASVEKVVNDLEANTTEFMDLLNEPVN